MTPDRLQMNGGGRLLSLYNNSVHNMMCALYPFVPWVAWKFQVGGAPILLQAEQKHQQLQHMQEQGQQTTQAKEMHFRQLLPDFLARTQLPQGFWENKENRKMALEWLAKRLRISHWEDWYEVTTQQIVASGCIALLAHYNNSPALMLQDLYPNHPWLPWKFNQVPAGFWSGAGNCRRYFDWIVYRFKLSHPMVLSRMSDTLEQNFGGRFAVRASLMQALQMAYPGR